MARRYPGAVADGFQERIARLRIAHGPALGEIAAQLSQDIKMGACLGAFANDFHVHLVRHRDGRAHDAHVARTFEHSRNERAIDLDFADRKTADIVQRRIAGAKVIDRNGYAKVCQVFQVLVYGGTIVDQTGFGDLQLEAVRSDTFFVDQRPDAPI